MSTNLPQPNEGKDTLRCVLPLLALNRYRGAVVVGGHYLLLS